MFQVFICRLSGSQSSFIPTSLNASLFVVLQDPPDSGWDHRRPVHRHHPGARRRRLRSPQKHQEEEGLEAFPRDRGKRSVHQDAKGSPQSLRSHKRLRLHVFLPSNLMSLLCFAVTCSYMVSWIVSNICRPNAVRLSKSVDVSFCGSAKMVSPYVLLRVMVYLVFYLLKQAVLQVSCGHSSSLATLAANQGRTDTNIIGNSNKK